uniref:Uncharacterized protein n=1 Tax=Anguilla anguilla TaxID=7936 RepID=A0A0E9R5F7_ANGAN
MVEPMVVHLETQICLMCLEVVDTHQIKEKVADILIILLLMMEARAMRMNIKRLGTLT